MEFKYSFGAIPSPIDERDYQITDLIPCSGQLPDTYINPLVSEIEILDQVTSNECVACSLSYLRWLTEYSQSNNKKTFSPAYIYANREYGMFYYQVLPLVFNSFIQPLYKDLLGKSINGALLSFDMATVW